MTTSTGDRTQRRALARFKVTVSALSGINIRLYLIGSSLSFIGSFVQNFAQWWLVLSITDNRSALPVTVGLQTLPILLLGTWGGSIVDRFDNRRLLGVTTILNTLTAVALGGLVVRGNVGVTTVYVFAVLTGLIAVFERPALQAIISEFARPAELQSAVGLNSMISPVSRLAGPPIAAVLIGSIGIAWCFFANAASFLVFLVTLLMTRRSEMLPRRQTVARKGLAKEGLRYARKDPVVGPVLLAMFFIGFAGFNFSTVMPLMARYTFHVGEGGLSIALSLSAVGSIIGGAAVAGAKMVDLRLIGIGALAFGVLLVTGGLAPNFVLWAAANFVIGIAGVGVTTMVISVLQKSSQPEMLGRVMALYSICFFGTTPFGALLVAVLTSVFNERAGLIAGGIVVVLTGVATVTVSKRARPTRVLAESA